jgi:hypothetical protein
MNEIDLPPFAPALVESMRAVGYTLESAIADLIDNSISASAKTVSIRYSPYEDPYLAIIDDGKGMLSDELTQAMRHGSRNPNDVRDSSDLGRFGLGLKTASLSQCRQLTVVSLKSGQISARRWDLDVIAVTERWTLLSLDEREINSLPFVDLLRAQERGTIVLWRNLDRVYTAEASIEAALGEGMIRVRKHLGLVFHRFVGEEIVRNRVKVLMNESEVEVVDPFLLWHTATQKLDEEIIRIGTSRITVQAYILPHYSKLDTADLELAGGEEGLRRQQGFYIYRNKRLIIWGTWFRLARQEELTKLARVRVDVPNTLDHLWTLDIKKSVAHPPVEVRENLYRIVDRISERSKRVYVYRGRRVNSDSHVHLWDRLEQRGGVTYRVNREHPLVASVLAQFDTNETVLLEAMLGQLEDMLPAEALYADMASDRRMVRQREQVTSEGLNELADRLLDACGTDPERRRNLVSGLHRLEPFVFFRDITQTIVARLQNEW